VPERSFGTVARTRFMAVGDTYASTTCRAEQRRGDAIGSSRSVPGPTPVRPQASPIGHWTTGAHRARRAQRAAAHGRGRSVSTVFRDVVVLKIVKRSSTRASRCRTFAARPAPEGVRIPRSGAHDADDDGATVYECTSPTRSRAAPGGQGVFGPVGVVWRDVESALSQLHGERITRVRRSSARPLGRAGAAAPPGRLRARRSRYRALSVRRQHRRCENAPDDPASRHGCFFASREQASKPSLRGKAVVVGGSGRWSGPRPAVRGRVFGVPSAMPWPRRGGSLRNAAYLRARFGFYGRSASSDGAAGALSPLVEP